MEHVYLLANWTLDHLFGMDIAPFHCLHPVNRSIQQSKIESMVYDHQRDKVVAKDVFVVQNRVYYGTVDLDENIEWDVAALNPFKNPDMQAEQPLSDALRSYAASDGDRIIVANTTIVNQMKKDIVDIIQDRKIITPTVSLRH